LAISRIGLWVEGGERKKIIDSSIHFASIVLSSHTKQKTLSKVCKSQQKKSRGKGERERERWSLIIPLFAEWKQRRLLSSSSVLLSLFLAVQFLSISS
jgi:hypothetical protein